MELSPRILHDVGEIEEKCTNCIVKINVNIAFISDNMMVIVEYCRFGNLQDILNKSRSSFVDQIDHDTDTIISSINAGKDDGENRACVDNSLYFRVANTVNLLAGETSFSYTLDLSFQ